MGAGSHKKLLASPGNFFLRRKGRVAELFAEFLGRSFLPLPHFSAVDHQIMRVALSLNLDLTKFDQSRFHISMFCWLERSAVKLCVADCISHFQIPQPTEWQRIGD